jgi:alpha galactosidase A-like protein/alpha galactosidase C-like protein
VARLAAWIGGTNVRLTRVLVLVPALCASLLVPGAAGASPALVWSSPIAVDPSGNPSSIACASSALCVTVDRSGSIFASTEPSIAATWRLVASDPTHTLTSVACAGADLCGAVDSSGRLLISTAPTEIGSWRTRTVDGSTAIDAIVCPSEALCLIADHAGDVLWSAEPDGAKPWTTLPIDTGHPLDALACASPEQCVAVDASGSAIAGGEPTVASSWHARPLDATPPLNALSCSAHGACVALDEAGNAFASANPLASPATWSTTAIDSLAVPTGVSCAAYGVCIAVDRSGQALVSEDAAAAAPTWASEPADPGGALTAVGCAPDGFCAAVDGQGRVVTSIVPAPAPSEPPVSLVTPHPTIAGVPAVGNRLVCEPGIPSGASASLAYGWVRDSSAITGAANSSYAVAKADATHHLQCLVTATDKAGSVTGHSGFVTIPATGVLAAVDETSVGRARSLGSRVQVTVRCSPRATHGCAISLRLTFTRVAHGRRVGVLLGSSYARLRAGQRRVLSVALGSAGNRMLSHDKHLSVKLSVVGTVIGALNAELSTQRLTLSLPARGQRLHGRAAGTRSVRGVGSARGSGADVGGVGSVRGSGADVGGVGSVRGSNADVVAGASSASANALVVSAAMSAPGPTVLSPTPYMGWDTYFAFGGRYSESTVLEQASALLTDGLAERGYRLVWLDAGWWQGQRDSHGQIVVSRSQWPHGMAWLAQTLHSAGLLVGLYTDAGSEGCGGRHQGSFDHYRQDANTFAAWGFDAVKVDFCGGVRQHLSPPAAYSAFHSALLHNSSHRPMLLSICDFLEPGQFHGAPEYSQSAFSSYSFGPGVGTSWRTDTDVGSPGHVEFATVLRNLDADAAHPEVAGPGHWNDPDYLGPDQGMSEAQFRTQLSMWSMLAAPLMVSVDLSAISNASRSALEDAEVLAIDQDPAGVQATLVSSEDEAQVWSRPLSDGSRAVALLNRGPVPVQIQTSAEAVGLAPASSYAVRDIWGRRSYSTSGALGGEVPGDSTLLLRVSTATGSHTARR